MAEAEKYLAPESQRTRRLSSMSATRADLFSGPTVLVPPKHLMAKPSDAFETAQSIELAKRHLDESTTSSEEATPASGSPVLKAVPTTDSPACSITDKYAFAFDIDGVLIRGGRVIPEAIEAMKVLNGENEFGIKVPYIFVTNGGGKTEEERCLDLSRQLELEVSPGQFICGHTPMREMAEKYHTVLVIGGVGEKCREVAEGYGFKDVITPGDIIKTNAETTPFRKLTEEEWKNSRVRDFDKINIEAIFVFADSRDWAGDQQIILDLLMSKNGRIGTRSETFQEGPPIYFSHNDIVWSTAHDYTRIGMGALRASLEALYKAVTGKELTTIAFGKPQLGTFEFATRLLRQWRKDTHGINKAPDTVYFVGDTPESDIRGTNEYNAHASSGDAEWFSILVKTGVFQEGTIPRYPPNKIANNVLDAVKFGMQREFAKAVKEHVINEADKRQIVDDDSDEAVVLE
ncbi:phosphatidyl synthase [Talaromyces stipitatus ATCC 10500]|uniref:Phosphatidyl synthase n=1 Tax=Talaromyces stipitatus (strain ATCC 10500 / CBS 375.48 / QM 6759 / NRRL 1006) TaxID=441959 RepID=B8MPF0_TALSN|nr:phosphatidyl synthase [Talaromyces stipitatus ATCC 10500]EED14389.1 phosphatidyl synthase [Talaromyces stipitatus ATCC 10500]